MTPTNTEHHGNAVYGDWSMHMTTTVLSFARTRTPLRLGWLGGCALALVALLGTACRSAEDSCRSFTARLNQCPGEPQRNPDTCAKAGSDADEVGCGGELADHYDCLLDPNVDACSNAGESVCSDAAFKSCLEKNCPAHKGSAYCELYGF